MTDYFQEVKFGERQIKHIFDYSLRYPASIPPFFTDRMLHINTSNYEHILKISNNFP